MTPTPAFPLPMRNDPPHSVENSVDLQGMGTIPNGLAAIRLVGAPLLVVLAFAGWPMVFFWWMIFLQATDWVDGKLAVLLNQRTSFGARLDSVADGLMYISLMIGLVILEGELLAAEWPWIAMAGASYVLTVFVAYRRFGRLPSYHTRMAKTGWLLVGLAVVSIFWEWEVRWPLRLAMATVTLTNLETTLISLTTRRWQRDVPSIFHAWQRDTEPVAEEAEEGPVQEERREPDD